MEKAFHVQNISQLQHFPAGFSRLYFGNETCERLIPSTEEVQKAKQFCKQKGISFSLVTPFCTDAGLAKLKPLLPTLFPEDELIANDFGVLKFASPSRAVKVAGRLLNKQARDPRIASFKQMPSGLLRHLSQSQASSPQFLKILSGLGARRVELDNLAQGIGTDLSKTGFSASLYFPLVFVAATRMCLLANAGKISDSKKAGILPCAQECSQFHFKLTNSCFPKPLLLTGNAIFFENESIPSEKELASLGIDRLVSNKAIAES
jgi:hypothetical protein